MTKLYDSIKILLKEYPYLRDSDKKLQWKVWQIQGYISHDTLSYGNFMNAKLISTETIRRTRQKIQEKCPELRGSLKVQALRDRKRKTKGTFIYREPIIYRFDGTKAIPV